VKDRAVPYTKGAHEVADGVWAYLQPDGGWGSSNAGLIASTDGYFEGIELVAPTRTRQS
jgi:hypothetical protein